MITIDDKISYPDLPMWKEFNTFTENSTKEILSVAHTTVRTRLAFAKTHLTIQKQAENIQLKRAMFEDVIINLVSSFEAIAHVLNAFYDLGIERRWVTIDHKYPNDEKRHIERSKWCLRCKLRKANLPLADLLDEVLKVESPTKHWYKALIEFRHQALHRQHFIALSTRKGYFLPDDPDIMTPEKGPYYDFSAKRFVAPNYTKAREIKKFTEVLYKGVIETIEAIYLLILEYNKVKPK